MGVVARALSSLGLTLLAVLVFVSAGVAFETGEDPALDTQVAADVALDAGHSIADVGAVGGGLRECDLTLDIAFRTRSELEARGFSVVMSRSGEGPLAGPSALGPVDRIRLEQEARIAAAGSARVYVSIHLNGYHDAGVRGTEVYYNGDNHGIESFSLGLAIQRELLARIAETGYLPLDRGVKEDLAAGKPYGHFFSLRGGMPSVLVEAMFLTNPVEAGLLSREEVRQAIAEAIAEGIAVHLEEPRALSSPFGEAVPQPGMDEPYQAEGTSDQYSGSS